MVLLRIKKEGKKKYYYLEHTIRQRKSFRNKRIYLGAELPKNIEEIKENFVYGLLEEIYDKNLISIKEGFSKEFSGYPESGKEKYTESFMIRFTYDSNRIEGSTLTLKETADLLQESITPRNKPLRDVKEAEAHKKVFYKMLEYNRELTLAVVLEWHRQLFLEIDPEIAGRIRKHNIAIARSKAELPFPAELNALLAEFFLWYQKHKDRMNPVVLAALVHLKFVTIHPFSDGNGRLSRLIMNFVLNKNKYPMLNIEYINRNAYYNSLERSQISKKEHIFVQYLVKRYLKAYKRHIKK